jgi:hypothetical protein
MILVGLVALSFALILVTQLVVSQVIGSIAENVKILVAFDEKLMNTMARTICWLGARFIGI